MSPRLTVRPNRVLEVSVPPATSADFLYPSVSWRNRVGGVLYKRACAQTGSETLQAPFREEGS